MSIGFFSIRLLFLLSLFGSFTSLGMSLLITVILLLYGLYFCKEPLGVTT